ncbi:MAG: hypothetical protein JNK54_00530 [Elusimicrobia bacterium]|jgi:cation:H+ antiporter|nr:hypothetical protein [Elusimicrobiota bacterium]
MMTLPSTIDFLWMRFVLSALFVVAAGISIGRVSGELGERLGLGRAWSGAVFLSLATTLPELVSSVTVVLRGAPGMAVGGILGSIVFNLFILALVDLVGVDSIYRRVSSNHVATGLLGCALLGTLVTGLSIGAGGGGMSFGLGHVGLTPLTILALFALGQFVLLRLARGGSGEERRVNVSTVFNRMSLTGLFFVYAGIAGVILVSAYNLGVAAQGLASHYSLGATFAGAILLGVVTSLPEISNATACAKKREFDLAVGNILGANAIVLTVLAIADLFYFPGRILSLLSPGEALSSIAMAGIAIVMQAIVLGALASRSGDRVWRVGIASLLLTSLYGASLLISYRFSTGPS